MVHMLGALVRNVNLLRVREINIINVYMAYLIDVRTKQEFDSGHAPEAINHDIMEMMQGVFPDVPKDAAITLYCESGNRSMMAKMFMEQAGFSNITDGGSVDNFM